MFNRQTVFSRSAHCPHSLKSLIRGYQVASASYREQVINRNRSIWCGHLGLVEPFRLGSVAWCLTQRYVLQGSPASHPALLPQLAHRAVLGTSVNGSLKEGFSCRPLSERFIIACPVERWLVLTLSLGTAWFIIAQRSAAMRFEAELRATNSQQSAVTGKGEPRALLPKRPAGTYVFCLMGFARAFAERPAATLRMIRVGNSLEVDGISHC